MAEKHTGLPWSIGRFLNLGRYRTMTKEWKDDRRREESMQVFSNFTEQDEGRSRIHICTLSNFDTEANRNFIIEACNNHYQLKSDLAAERKRVGVLEEILKPFVAWLDGEKDAPFPYGACGEAKAALPDKPEGQADEQD